MPVIRNLRRRTVISSVMNKDAFWGLVAALFKPKSGAGNGQQNLTFSDSSPNNFTVTRAGNVSYGNLSPYGNTGGSMYFDGSGDELLASIGTNFYNRAFTIECWFYPNSVYANASLFMSSVGTGNYAPYIHTGWSASGSTLTYMVCDSALSSIVGTKNVVLNTWNHVALVRESSGTIKAYLNGVLDGTASSRNTPNITMDLYVGMFHQTSGGGARFPFTGYISDLRVVMDSAVYTTNFTPTTTPLTAISGTTLLLSSLTSAANANITDYTKKGAVETGGNAQVASTVKKFTTGTMYFDGTGDYITKKYPDVVDWWKGDFTVEAWVKPYKLHTQTTYGIVIGRMSPLAGSINDWSFGLDSSNRVVFYYWTTGANTITGASSANLFEWTHIAMTHKNGTIRLFRDGVLEATATVSGTPSNTAGTPLTVGGYNNSVWFKGYLEDVRMTSGVARYLTDFAVETVSANDNRETVSTSLITSAVNNGTNATILDSSTNALTVTRYGDVTQGTFSPFANTGYSTYFGNSTSDTITFASNAAFALGTGDFTAEAWVNLNDFGATTQRFILIGQSGTDGLAIGMGSTTNLIVSIMNSAVITYGVPTSFLGRWNHIAVTRQGTTVTLWVNGVAAATGTNSGNITQYACNVGGLTWATGINTRGFLKDVRIVKGTAVYTTDFTPTTTPLTAIANTILLTCQTKDRIKDNSTNNFTATIGGTPSADTFSPYASESYSPTTHGGSLYFDGTGDYLKLPGGQAGLTFGTGDFTIECWFYSTMAVTNAVTGIIGPLFDGRISGNGNYPYLLLGSTDAGNTGGKLGWFVNGAFAIIGTLAVPINTWHHVAVSRSGTSTRMFLNGKQTGSTFNDSTNYLAPTPTIGANYDASGRFGGYISDMRVIKGTALYTAEFTPPTAPLTAIANTQLLLNGTNCNVYDKFSRSEISLNGSAKVSTAVKKFTSSLAFDGTTNCYAALTTPKEFTFGTGNFTIELWFNRVSGTGSQMLIDFRPATTQGIYPVLYINVDTPTWYVNSANVISGVAITNNTWYHIAVSRSSGTTRMFLNGVQVGSSYTDTNAYIFGGTGRPTIGGMAYTLGSELFNGYIEGLKITKGYARYVTGFVPPTSLHGTSVKSLPTSVNSAAGTSVDTTVSTDPYYGNVTTHMTMNGVNGSTSIVDQRSRVSYTTTQSPVLSTDYAKFGNTSAAFQNGTFLSCTQTAGITPTTAGFLNGTDVYTFETWLYLPTRIGANILGDISTDLTYWAHSWDLYVDSNGKFGYSIRNASTPYVITGTTTIPLNTWTHIAFVVNKGVTRGYVNGVLDFTGGVTSGATDTGVLTIGSRGTYTASDPKYYLDDLRITMGIARYTGNFTPPSAEYPGIACLSTDTFLPNTSIIRPVSTAVTNNYYHFVDKSANSFVMTKAGDIKQTTNSPYGTVGGSAYLDGNGDYLITPVTANINLGSSDFTIEAWVYPTSVSTQITLICCGPAGGGGLNRGYAVGINDGTNLIAFKYGTATAATFGASSTLNINAWNHLAITRNGTSLKCFVNGVQSGSTVTMSASVPDATVGSDYLGIGGNDNSNNGTPGRFWYSGYVADLHIVKGTAIYTGNFTPPSAPLTVIANTQLLLPLDGARQSYATDNNSTIIDSSANALTVTKNGNVAQGTFSPFSNSGFSTYFNGSSCITYPSNAAYNINTATFTIEYWHFCTTYNAAVTPIMGRRNYAQGSGWAIGTSATGYPRMSAYTTVWTDPVLTASNPVPLNKWTHVAWVRQGTSLKVYINGVLSGTATVSALNVDGALPLAIGTAASNSPEGYTNGYISNLRMVTGTAVYTGNFTPPTTALTAISGTVLLCCTGNTLNDISSNKAVATVFAGTPTVFPAAPFTPAKYVPATHGGSMYFDGTSDYLSIPYSDSLAQWWANGYTLEAWVYPVTYTTSTSNANTDPVLIGNTAVGAANSYWSFGLDSTGKIKLYYWNGSQVRVTGASVAPLNTWTHIAMTVTSSSIKFYMNGVLDATNSVSGTPQCGTTSNGFYVGASGNGNFNGYVANLRVVNSGTAVYTGAFTPPSAPLTAVSNTQLLLSGTNSAVIDVNGRLNIDTSGNAATVRRNRFEFDPTVNSLYFDGSSTCFIGSPAADSSFNFGTGNFTIEGWFNTSGSTPVYNNVVSNWSSAFNTAGDFALRTRFSSTEQVVFTVYNGSAYSDINTGTSVSDGVWHHIAVSRVNGYIYICIDGVVKSMTAYATKVGNPAAYATLGNVPVTRTNEGAYTGTLYDLRVTKGVGRYSSNFTVPVCPFPTPTV